MTARTALAPAFVLHHRPYRDTSLLLELFTRDHGRIGLVARGARRPKSGNRAFLQPLQPLLVGWSGRGELKTLTAVEPDGRAPVLGGVVVYSVFYINELLLRLLARDDPHPRLFAVYQRSLFALGGERDAALLRSFEKSLLEEIGYGLNLAVEADTGGPVRADAWYAMDPEAGPRPVAEGTATAVAGDSLLALAGGRLDTVAQERDARHILQAALACHLGPRPLHTPRLLRALTRRQRDPDRKNNHRI